MAAINTAHWNEYPVLRHVYNIRADPVADKAAKNRSSEMSNFVSSMQRSIHFQRLPSFLRAFPFPIRRSQLHFVPIKSRLKKVSWWKWGAATGTLGFGTSLWLFEDKRLSRPLLFWKGMMPIYIHYRWVEWQLRKESMESEERRRQFEALHEMYAPRVLSLVLQLRGIFIKVGQMGVARPDILPEIYRKHFRVLLDQVPPLPADQVRPLVEEAIGTTVEDMFSEFDWDALGAASIGQVHRARLKSTGQEVVVKIKYPDSELLFQSDMTTLKRFCRIAQPEQMVAMDEMERQFLKEVDFAQEGHALERVRSTVEPQFPNVRIPRPVFYNRDVVIMEYLPGIKLMDAVLDEYERLAGLMGMSLHEMTEKFVRGQRFKPSWGQILFLGAYRLTEHMKYYINVTCILFHNVFIGWISGWWHYPRPPLNPTKTFQTVVDVHAYEIFMDGFFNGASFFMKPHNADISIGDPHPGNILLLDDGNLGLIDYGQVKELSVEERRALSEFIIALERRDKEKVVEMMRRLGHRTKYNDKEVQWELALVAFDRDDGEVMGGLSFQQKMEELDKRDPAVSTADCYIFVGRVSLLLRGLSALLNQPSLSIVKAWKPWAERFLRENPEGLMDRHVA